MARSQHQAQEDRVEGGEAVEEGAAGGGGVILSVEC